MSWLRGLQTAACILATVYLGAGTPSAAENPDADILHMDVFGVWEAWCVKRHAEPKPACFVVNSIVYSPRPNFAAIVLYFHPPALGRTEPSVRLGLEAKSTLGPGYVKVDGEDALNTLKCALPGACTLNGDNALSLISAFGAGKAVSWRHYDYAVKPVNLEMDLTGFAKAYAQTEIWAKALEAKAQ